MVLIGGIMAVAVQSRGEILLEPVSMAMGFRRLRMVLEGDKRIRDWRPEHKAQAMERGQAPLYPSRPFPGNPCLYLIPARGSLYT